MVNLGSRLKRATTLQAFYAYGSFLKYFDNNPLKKIFLVQMLGVQKLALSFGFHSSSLSRMVRFSPQPPSKSIEKTKKDWPNPNNIKASRKGGQRDEGIKDGQKDKKGCSWKKNIDILEW